MQLFEWPHPYPRTSTLCCHSNHSYPMSPQQHCHSNHRWVYLESELLCCKAGHDIATMCQQRVQVGIGLLQTLLVVTIMVHGNTSGFSTMWLKERETLTNHVITYPDHVTPLTLICDPDIVQTVPLVLSGFPSGGLTHLNGSLWEWTKLNMEGQQSPLHPSQLRSVCMYMHAHTSYMHACTCMY